MAFPEQKCQICWEEMMMAFHVFSMLTSNVSSGISCRATETGQQFALIRRSQILCHPWTTKKAQKTRRTGVQLCWKTFLSVKRMAVDVYANCIRKQIIQNVNKRINPKKKKVWKTWSIENQLWIMKMCEFMVPFCDSKNFGRWGTDPNWSHLILTMYP